MDEPTLGLDAATKKLFWDLIRKIKHERTILICSKNIDEADS
jgi:ABC-type multidrug transport system ATPase subunit